MTWVDPRLVGIVDRLARGLASAPLRARREWPMVDAKQRTYFRIGRQPGYELWLIRWPAGSLAPLHDHGGATGAAAIVDGELGERVYVGSAEPSWREERWTAGRVSIFGPDHLHEVRNDTDQPACSLHLYAPGLHTMTFFAASPRGELEPSRRETELHW